ncbi:MAG TPA: hypothetical protein VJ110_00270 [Candidatus Nanoarchaeia archaeon]|nr:hypothetical protein [Candidatus Nanoarchaeia archaeon]
MAATDISSAEVQVSPESSYVRSQLLARLRAPNPNLDSVQQKFLLDTAKTLEGFGGLDEIVPGEDLATASAETVLGYNGQAQHILNTYESIVDSLPLKPAFAQDAKTQFQPAVERSYARYLEALQKANFYSN